MKKAFTLSEILITLGIIGVVAAITIPTIIQKTQKQETYSKLLKAQSTLSNIASAERNDNGGSFSGLVPTSGDFFKLFSSNMKTIKLCYGSSDSPKCYVDADDTIYNLHGGYYNGHSLVG